MPPNREPSPRKAPTEHWGQAAVTLPRPICRTTQAAEPEQLRIPPPKCEGSAASAHTQRAADAEHRGGFDAVHAADVIDRRAVFAGQGAERIARTDLVVALGGLLGSLLLVLLLVGDLVL